MMLEMYFIDFLMFEGVNEKVWIFNIQAHPKKYILLLYIHHRIHLCNQNIPSVLLIFEIAVQNSWYLWNINLEAIVDYSDVIQMQ